MFISPSVFSPSCAVWTLSPKSLVAAAGHRLFLLQLLKSLRLHRLLWLLSCSGCFGCLLWLPAFIPYAKVKKLILTHYILFIWKDRSMFFSDVAFPSRMLFSPLPDGSPWHQHLCHGAPASISASAPLPATSSRWRSATAPLPATNLIRRRKLLRFG